MNMELIKSFNYKLATPDCLPEAEWYRTTVVLDNDISEVLPYLNAEFKGADYNHKTKVLLWPGEGKKYAFRPHEIVITPVGDREEARQAVEDIISTVNAVWSRRGELEPNFEGKKPLPNVLSIYKLLPRTNCQECGSLSCMAFAAAIRSDSAKLSLCPYISEQDLSALG